MSGLLLSMHNAGVAADMLQPRSGVILLGKQNAGVSPGQQIDWLTMTVMVAWHESERYGLLMVSVTSWSPGGRAVPGEMDSW